MLDYKASSAPSTNSTPAASSIDEGSLTELDIICSSSCIHSADGTKESQPPDSSHASVNLLALITKAHYIAD